jgi:hypothetical protein
MKQLDLFSKRRLTRDPKPRGTYAGSSRFWQTLMPDERELVQKVDSFILGAKQGIGKPATVLAGTNYNFIVSTLRNFGVFKKYHGIKFSFSTERVQIWFLDKNTNAIALEIRQYAKD